MIIKKELIKRTIGNDTVLIPVGKTVLDSNGLFVLNELGVFIWDLLPSHESTEDICAAVLKEYDVSEAEAETDIAVILEKLRALQII